VVRPGELPEGVGVLELRREIDTALFDKALIASDNPVTAEARADLLYGLACCDRLQGGGLELLQSVRHAITDYWADTSRRKKKTPEGAVTTSAVSDF
jgi:hypothetical protein